LLCSQACFRALTGEHGYTETTPPFLVHTHTMYGTAQLPKFEDDQYRIADFNLAELEKRTREQAPETDGVAFMGEAIRENSMWLLPTAEVALTNIVRESIVEPALNCLTAWWSCVRVILGSGRGVHLILRSGCPARTLTAKFQAARIAGSP